MADTLQPPQRTKSGKHPEKALSAAFVRTVTAPGKYNDGQGLFLKVDPSGARRWVQRIVIRGACRNDGKQYKLVTGSQFVTPDPTPARP